ncbi:hypothetical protein Bca4012_075369 [Brassica carinata]
MAFWGWFNRVEVKPGKPFTLKANTNDSKRLHLSQATLGMTSNSGTTSRSILQCNAGNKSPLFLCVLSPEKVDTCQLNIEFQEAEDVIFSVIGPRSVHLTGYFLARNGTGVFVKERIAKTKAKKKSKRLRKKFQVSDSDSDANEDSVEILSNDHDHKIPKVLSSEVPFPSKVTCSTLENTSEAMEKKEDKLSGDVDELSPLKKGSEVLPKKKKRNKESVVINTDEAEEKDMPETDKNIKKEASAKKLPESEISPNEVATEEIEKGKLDGKVAVQGKKVSILYTGKLKDSGKVFESNLEEGPLRFRLGMRAGDKRRLIIPPSLGYTEEGLNKEDVPKNSWLIYEVEAVKSVTKECKQLFAWLASYSSGQVTVEPPKQKSTKNNKSWSKSKDKKKKSQIKRTVDSHEEDNTDRQDDDSTSDEEKPKSRRKIFTIRTASSPVTAVTGLPKEDLRESLNHKMMKTTGSPTFPAFPWAMTDDKETRTLNASDDRHMLEAKRKNSHSDGPDGVEATDLHIKLNAKVPDLREKLKRHKANHPDAPSEQAVPYQRQTLDLRTKINHIKAERSTRSDEERLERPLHLNVIMGGVGEKYSMKRLLQLPCHVHVPGT